MAGIGYIDFKNPAMTGAITDATSRMLLASGKSIMDGIDEMAIKTEAGLLGPRIGKSYAQGYRRLSQGDMGGWDDVAEARSLSVTNPLLLKSAQEADEIAKAITAAHYQEKLSLELQQARERMSRDDNLTRIAGQNAAQANQNWRDVHGPATGAAAKSQTMLLPNGNIGIIPGAPPPQGGATDAPPPSINPNDILPPLPGQGSVSRQGGRKYSEPPLPATDPLQSGAQGEAGVPGQQLPSAVQNGAQQSASQMQILTGQDGKPVSWQQEESINRKYDIPKLAESMAATKADEMAAFMELSGAGDLAETVSEEVYKNTYASIVSDKVYVASPDKAVSAVIEKDDSKEGVLYKVGAGGISSETGLTETQKAKSKEYVKNTDMLHEGLAIVNSYGKGAEFYVAERRAGHTVDVEEEPIGKSATSIKQTFVSSSGRKLEQMAELKSPTGQPYDASVPVAEKSVRKASFEEGVRRIEEARNSLKRDGIDVQMVWEKGYSKKEKAALKSMEKVVESSKAIEEAPLSRRFTKDNPDIREMANVEQRNKIEAAQAVIEKSTEFISIQRMNLDASANAKYARGVKASTEKIDKEKPKIISALSGIGLDAREAEKVIEGMLDGRKPRIVMKDGKPTVQYLSEGYSTQKPRTESLPSALLPSIKR